MIQSEVIDRQGFDSECSKLNRIFSDREEDRYAPAISTSRRSVFMKKEGERKGCGNRRVIPHERALLHRRRDVERAE